MIVVKDLKKNYNGLDVLKGIDLTINKGDVVCLVGPSGCGKSTFLRCLTRLEEPDGGTVMLDGKEITERDIDATRAQMGMVFQHFNLFPHLTVKKNITLAPVRLGRMSQAAADKQAMELLERIGLADKADVYPNMLSGGQKQRVAIAGVMAMKPQCIVLDEPTAMLDPNGRAEVIRTVRELNRKEGITAVLITHYMEEVIDADRVIVMDDGAIVMDGTPREVFSQVEKLKEYRLDVPQATELAYELKKAGVDLPDGILSQEEFVEAFLACCPGELLTEGQTGNADGDSCGSHSSCRDTESREEQTEAAGR